MQALKFGEETLLNSFGQGTHSAKARDGDMHGKMYKSSRKIGLPEVAARMDSHTITSSKVYCTGKFANMLKNKMSHSAAP